MTELVVQEQHWRCAAERPCDGDGCDLPAASSAVWWDRQEGEVHLLDVCGFHRWAFEGRGLSVQFFPLDEAPPLEYVVQRINAHLQQQRYANFFNNATHTARSGAWTTFTFNWSPGG